MAGNTCWCLVKLCIEIKVTGPAYLKVIEFESDFIYFFYRGEPKKMEPFKSPAEKAGPFKGF